MAAAYRAQYGFSTISLMPTNLYGPGDNFDLQNVACASGNDSSFPRSQEYGRTLGHLWGTGTPRREFLHVDDLANAACFVMEHYDGLDLLNVGVGEDLTIAELAEMVARVVGYNGRIVFDSSRPDGTPRKLLDVSRIHALGWRARIPLDEGVAATYAWYAANNSVSSSA